MQVDTCSRYQTKSGGNAFHLSLNTSKKPPMLYEENLGAHCGKNVAVGLS